MARTDKTLDIKGLLSPRCEMLAESTLSRMETGQTLMVITTDRSVKQNLSDLCQRLGYALLDIREEAGAMKIQIQK